ncbi:hypothetical protein AG1IA_07952 [Rhizoctonia solani AG-1 IA]|uniref:Uncharacterized protein n=1 Tax=Thanatephorus cucumeris (strain AG1-IA) TaxID=983506 RepID=L8WNT9_THACA|nr:hypothetical protein AG1IA_07952 [Rhizoctonia solani AG-1 IA]
MCYISQHEHQPANLGGSLNAHQPLEDHCLSDVAHFRHDVLRRQLSRSLRPVSPACCCSVHRRTRQLASSIFYVCCCKEKEHATSVPSIEHEILRHTLRGTPPNEHGSQHQHQHPHTAPTLLMSGLDSARDAPSRNLRGILFPRTGFPPRLLEHYVKFPAADFPSPKAQELRDDQGHRNAHLPREIVIILCFFLPFKLFWPASRYGLCISPREWQKTDSIVDKQLRPGYQIPTIYNIGSGRSFVLPSS